MRFRICTSEQRGINVQPRASSSVPGVDRPLSQQPMPFNSISDSQLARV
jgi:hypothetical protein